MFPKQLLFIGLFIAMSFITCCDERQDKTTDTPDMVSGTYYHFYPGKDSILEGARKIQSSEKMTRQRLIEQFGAYLSENYFAKTDGNQKTEIQFDLISINAIHTRRRTFYIAVVNMIDKQEAGLRYFFQGSFGGQVTFAMIAATFLQPQNHPPLLDGLILQYNGEPFPDLDHINFKGVVTPVSVERMALSALNLSNTQSSDLGGQ